MTLGDTLNNRELAIAAWAVLLFAGAMANSGMRASLKRVARAFANRHILIILALMTAYIALVIWGLSEASIWDMQQLKTTIIWAVFVAFVSIMDLESVTEDANYFKKAVKDNLKLIVVLEFIVSFYTLARSMVREVLQTAVRQETD